MKRPAKFLLAGSFGAALCLCLILVRSQTTAHAVSGSPGSEGRGDNDGQGTGLKGPSLSSRVERAAPSPVGASPSPKIDGIRVQAAWGSGSGQLGRSQPEEGDPEGPASFALDKSGRAWVLDPVNDRIVRYDQKGKPVDAIPTTLRAPEEITIAPDGSVLVMDRLGDKSVAILDPEGKVRGELPITGRGMEEGGSATGLFADEQGVYVENEHGELIRIGDAAGKVDTERPTLDGRPTRDGKSLLSAGFIDPAAGRLWVRLLDRATGAVRFQKQVVLDVPYFSIVFLDSDRAGGIYVGAHVGRELQPGKVTDEAIRVVCLGAEGGMRGNATFPASTLPDTSFRDLAVQDDGTLLYMARSESGATLRAQQCR